MARHQHRHVIIDTLVQAEAIRQAIARREFDPGVAFRLGRGVDGLETRVHWGLATYILRLPQYSLGLAYCSNRSSTGSGTAPSLRAASWKAFRLKAAPCLD